jgi:YVTN family beta-propeller protein
MKHPNTQPGKALTLFTLALLVCLSGARTSRGQIGGPKDLKPAGGAKSAAAAPVEQTFSRRFEKEGIAVEFKVRALPADGGEARGLAAGADAVATFRVSDASTGNPIAGLRPNAWIDEHRDRQALGEAACVDKIRTFMGGLLSARADIDLNSYLLLTLNHDSTVTFINPQVSFNITKLEGIVPLPGVGADWALSKDKEWLFVTLPEQSAVAVINTVTKKLAGTIPTGEKTRPRRIALQPDGHYLWVAMDGSPVAAVIDAEARRLAGTVPLGRGLHNIAFTADSRYALVTNSDSDSVSVIDAARLVKLADVGVGRTPVAVAYSDVSRLVYVAALNGTAVSAVDPAKQRVVKNIPVRRGVVALRFAPGGRYGYAVNQVDSSVSVLDAATDAFVGSAGVVKEPDQVVFSDGYAYVRGQGSEKFSLIELSTAAKGRVSPVNVQAGQKPPSARPEEIGVADMIAATPAGNAAMIANGPEQMIYYYVEGMMAPMGTLSNYKRRARALMLLDRSLTEIAPGVYSSPVKLRKAGRFDVPFLLDQPRLAHCFEFSVAASADAEEARAGDSIAVEALFAGSRSKVGETVPLKFKITDPVSKQPVAGLGDVQVLVFEPGVWQQRRWAEEVKAGEYEVRMKFPHTGLFKVMLRVASRGVEFADLPHTQVPVDAGAGDGKPPDK